MKNFDSSVMCVCRCNYKCGHSSQGFQIVNRSTYYYHASKDSRGITHYSLDREVETSSQNATNNFSSIEHPIFENINDCDESNSQGKMKCYCKSYCPQGRLVAPSTFFMHKQINEKYNSIRKQFGLMDHNTFEYTLESTSNLNDIEHIREALNSDRFQVDSTNVVENPSNDIDNIERVDHSIDDKILKKLIEMQALWDDHGVSLEFQDAMLKLLFGSYNGSHDANPCLSRLLVQLPSSWDGNLNGLPVPSSWKKFNQMLYNIGMVESIRYRICQGKKDEPHEPELLGPSVEDNNSNVNLVYCICSSNEHRKKLLKRDCVMCCDKCNICSTPRKEMISFDRIPIGAQLRLLCKSRSICHELLMLNRNKNSEECNMRNEFWEGEKFKEYKDFFDHNSSFEMPIVCSTCRQHYRAWPNSSRLFNLFMKPLVDELVDLFIVGIPI